MGETSPARTGELARTFSHALLQGEQHENRELQRAFFTDLHKHGFARLRLGDEDAKCLMAMYDQAHEFFALPQYFKDSVCPYQPALEIGYAHVPHQAKEFFAVRLTADGQSIATNGAELIPDDYQQLAVASFKLLDRIAKNCLAYIAAGLEVDSTKLTSLAEAFPLEGGQAHSVSFLHVFKYVQEASVPMPCPPHTDSGLVTVIPCAQHPGLEILDWQTSQWRSLEEEGANSPTDCVVLIGETLARLTCAHLQASVHRVTSRPGEESGESWTRYSLPFQLRGRLDAVLDSVALTSPVLPDVPKPLREPVTVCDFIHS